MESIYHKEKINLLLKSVKVTDLLNKLNIKCAITFGSINTDDFNELSDVDIAIIGDSKIKLESILELEIYLENILRREIDVVDLRSDNLSLFIKIGILNDGILFFSVDDKSSFQELWEKVERIYKENENFIYFRKKDVLS